MIDASLEHFTCKHSRNEGGSKYKRGFKPFYWKKMINIQRRKEKSHAQTRRTAI